MTEQEKLIIQSIKEMGFDRTVYRRDLVSAVILKAIQVFEQTQLENGDKAISLNAVIKAVDKHTNEDGTLDDDISCILEDIPSAEQKIGHWIDRWEEEGCEGDSIRWRCSECKELSSCNSNFCGDCGSYNEGDDNE